MAEPAPSVSSSACATSRATGSEKGAPLARRCAKTGEEIKSPLDKWCVERSMRCNLAPLSNRTAICCRLRKFLPSTVFQERRSAFGLLCTRRIALCCQRTDRFPDTAWVWERSGNGPVAKFFRPIGARRENLAEHNFWLQGRVLRRSTLTSGCAEMDPAERNPLINRAPQNFATGPEKAPPSWGGA